jgi:hypothetical protein
MLLREGQITGYEGTAIMLDAVPQAKAILGDKGYTAEWLRDVMTVSGVTL